MKRTTLLTATLAIAIIIAAKPAIAMRDPGGPGGPYADGMNLYQYARSDPAGHRDPSGLFGGTTHEVITLEVLANNVRPRLAQRIAAENRASDDWLTFILNPYAHALSYTQAPLKHTQSVTEYNEEQRRNSVISKWQQFVEATQQTFIDKLKRSCCDCTAAVELGRLLHSWQDRYYHQFHSWVGGWHWRLGGENIPCQEEAALDELLADNEQATGSRQLAKYLASPDQTRKDSNAAIAALPAAVEISRRVVENTRRAVGDDCWRTWASHCDKMLYDQRYGSNATPSPPTAYRGMYIMP
jgi:hypothetical protein